MMTILRLILGVLFLTSIQAAAAPPHELLFWTGFEGTTKLDKLQQADCWNNGCWQDLSGTDSVTGFNWPPRIWGGTARYQMLTNPQAGARATADNVGESMFNEVQTVTGHKGAQTRAMYSAIVKPGGEDTQNPFILLPDSESPVMYISQWVKLQPDLLEQMRRGTWRDLFEFKTTDTDYRLELGIVNFGGGTPLWQIRGDGWIPDYKEYWRVQNRSVPVPIGEWFKLEVYWRRSATPEGRVWMAVNGSVLLDRRGANTGPNGSRINRIMVNQLYSGGSYPIYQWMDDLQIWSDFPSARSGDPWYDPPYAPHGDEARP
jgi:hypothetical protein